MRSVGKAFRAGSLTLEERTLLGLVPAHRKEFTLYHGTYNCPGSGLTVILEEDVLGPFILCDKACGGECAESPEVFAALEGLHLCLKLWR